MTEPASDHPVPHGFPFSRATVDRRAFMQQTALGLLAASWSGAQTHAAELSSAYDDRRLGPLKTLNGDFPFTVPASLDAWNKRREELRRQILVATGLWPMPPRPPISATIHGKVEKNDCIVERVFFESTPGLYLTGSLYRPKQAVEKHPVVLCPHGHWKNGRFFAHGDDEVKKEVATGGEKFERGGRYPLQARCFQLARMGCIVFHYDMLGYADSAPITEDLAHRFKQQRPHLSQPDRWGLFSAQAELRLISVLGLQTFHSVRALDFVLTLPHTDASRIGVTGASGGGSQTFLLMAIDDRPTAAFPAVMVSTKMQGGCTCENAEYLRVNTGNIEIAGLAAPRPLGMSAADDWTKQLETLGLPELKQLYAMYGVPNHVEGKYFPFPHNYNYPSRAMMYEFFNKHLSLHATSPIVEPDFEPLTQEELTVWSGDHPKPQASEDAEVAILRAWSDRSDEQINSLVMNSTESARSFEQIIGGAWQAMIGRSMPTPEAVAFQPTRELTLHSAPAQIGFIRHASVGEAVPAWIAGDSFKNAVVWVTPDGKGAMATSPSAASSAQRILKAGLGLIAIDVLGHGDARKDEIWAGRSRATENGREAACFSFGYNHPLFAQRVHDVLSAVACAKQRVGAEGKVHLVADAGAGPWGAAAAYLAGAALERVALVLNGFRFAQITDIRDPELLPGAVKYGDVPFLVALRAPHPLFVAGEGPASLAAVTRMYSPHPESLKIEEAVTPKMTEQMVGWIIG